jgi:flagellar assembly protein FliH
MVRIQRLVFESLEDDQPPAESTAMQTTLPEAEIEALEIIPPEPVYNTEELEHCRAEAHEAGFQRGIEAGYQKAKQEWDGMQLQLMQAVERIARNLDGFIQQYQRDKAENEAMMVRTILAISRKVAHHALALYGVREVEMLVQECVESLIDERMLTVIAHPDMVPLLQERIRQTLAKQGFNGEIYIEGDANLSLSDCQINWRHGSAERNTETIWQQVEEILSRLSEKARVVPTDSRMQTASETHSVNEEMPITGSVTSLYRAT